MIFALLVAVAVSAEPSEPLLSPPPPPPSASAAGVDEAPAPPQGQPVSLRGYEGTRFKYDAKLGVPTGFHLVSQPRWALVIVGAGMFLASYAFAIYAGSGGWGFVPLVGPAYLTVAAFGVLGCSGCGTGIGILDGIGGALIFIYGLGLLSAFVFQAAGIALTIFGLASPRKWLERDDAALRPRASLVPFVHPVGGGLALVGRF